MLGNILGFIRLHRRVSESSRGGVWLQSCSHEQPKAIFSLGSFSTFPISWGILDFIYSWFFTFFYIPGITRFKAYFRWKVWINFSSLILGAPAHNIEFSMRSKINYTKRFNCFPMHKTFKIENLFMLSMILGNDIERSAFQHILCIPYQELSISNDWNWT